jgi:molecular chaperone GrpE (heat shock protein)
LLADGETRQSAVADFARELLADADNLQRALAAIGEEARRGRDR